MENYYWSTEYPHSTNSETMSEYLEMQESFPYQQHLTVTFIDGSYAEGIDCKGNKWAVHASGDGDSYTHKFTFNLLESAHP
jgi:hypothetical protein